MYGTSWFSTPKLLSVCSTTCYEETQVSLNRGTSIWKLVFHSELSQFLYFMPQHVDRRKRCQLNLTVASLSHWAYVRLCLQHVTFCPERRAVLLLRQLSFLLNHRLAKVRKKISPRQLRSRLEEIYRHFVAWLTTRYDTMRDAILTRAEKLT